MSSHLDYEINKELGECYLFMGELDKAEGYYQKAADAGGAHPAPYLGLATIAVQRGDLGQAHGLYAKAAAMEASDKALAGMALVEMEMGKADAAFDHLRAALGHNPENVVALYSLVRLGHAQGRVDEVLAHLEDYLALDPLKHEVRYTLAGCLISLGRQKEARGHLERILEHDPHHAQALELLREAKAA